MTRVKTKWNTLNFKKFRQFLKIKKRNKRDTNSEIITNHGDGVVNGNEVKTCFGGLDDNEVRKIQEDLEKAMQENEQNFSTKSKCTLQ